MQMCWVISLGLSLYNVTVSFKAVEMIDEEMSSSGVQVPFENILN